MAEVRFYHLTRSPLEAALPKLLEKCIQGGLPAVVMASSSQRVESLDQLLWTYARDSFLPHGSARDGRAERQPIWLTDTDERPNAATVLFLVDGAESARFGEYTRVCDLFNGRDEDAVLAARVRWQRAKADAHELSYWQQDPKRGWVRNA
jgi:DNA polymerase-3 subunit chi